MTRDQLQQKAERIGATKSQLFWAARNDTLIADRYRITKTDEGLTLEDTQDIQTPDAIEPGVYDDKSNADYHAGPGISSSQIKRVMGCAPEKVDERTEPSKAMRFGTHVHTCILEPEEWARQKAITPPDASSSEHKASLPVAAAMVERAITYSEAAECPDVQGAVLDVMPTNWNRDTALGKVSREVVDFYAEHGVDFEPLDEDRIRKAEAMRDALHDCPAFSHAILDDARKEVSIYWYEDTEYGRVLCKCRPDALLATHLLDLKTTRDASEDSFGRDCYNFGYHVSASFYQRGVAQAGLTPIDTYTLLAVEKGDNPTAGVYDLDQGEIAQAQRLWRTALELIAKYRATPNAYGGYTEKPRTLTLPSWAASKDEAKVERMERRIAEMQAGLPDEFK